eukprot:4500686-Ditylum_brightwellii.AAC.1
MVNIVMGKEVGNNKIHRTRILSIYKADYSVFIGLMWKNLLSSSEKRGTLNRGLHRGRHGHNVQTLSLIEELKYNICHCSRKSLINFNNDEASCCDRILPSIPSLVARKKGLHKNVIFVYVQILEQAKYRLRTALVLPILQNIPYLWQWAGSHKLTRQPSNNITITLKSERGWTTVVDTFVTHRLSIGADTNKNVQIQYKSILNPHKTLGHYKAPAGTGRVQATVLADCDKQYACRVTKSSLTRHEAWIY